MNFIWKCTSLNFDSLKILSKNLIDRKFAHVYCNIIYYILQYGYCITHLFSSAISDEDLLLYNIIYSSSELIVSTPLRKRARHWRSTLVTDKDGWNHRLIVYDKKKKKDTFLSFVFLIVAGSRQKHKYKHLLFCLAVTQPHSACLEYLKRQKEKYILFQWVFPHSCFSFFNIWRKFGGGHVWYP